MEALSRGGYKVRRVVSLGTFCSSADMHPTSAGNLTDACVGSRCPCRCEGVRAARMHRWKVMVEDWVDGSTLGGEPLDPPRFYALAMRAPQTMAQARCVSVRTLQRSDAEQFESSYAPATEIVAGSACGGAGTARD